MGRTDDFLLRGESGKGGCIIWLSDEEEVC